ncbi:MAG: fibronectin type III domain-containing protein [Opitutales bacterium]|nr:fibronectin type III domain-containing protein [Opitutales bacterium]
MIRTFCILALSACVYSQLLANPAPNVLRYGKFETEFVNSREYSDPFRDTTLHVEFSNPGGENVHLIGFYDGNATWRVRFRPDFPGIWKYKAKFSDSDEVIEGTFRCLWRYAQHDPVKVNPVTPIWFARGVTPFQVRALHVGDRFFADNWSETERRLFLNWFQTQGYNTLSIASHYLNRQEDGRGNGWQTPDLWPLNLGEFRKLEAHLDELERRGIVVFPFAGFFGKNSDFPKDPNDQELWVRYVMARIGHYGNLLYNVAGPEPDMKNHEFLSRDSVNQLGRLIQKYDVYDHPLTVHCPTGPDLYRDSDWTTFGTIQGPKTLDRNELHQGLLESLNPQKPLFAQETLWSGNIFHQKRAGKEYTDDDIRKNAYVICMSGAGFCFADNNGNSSTGFSGSLNLRDRNQQRHDIIKIVWDFFDSIPYFEMTPQPELVDNGICLAEYGENYLVYLENRGKVNVDVSPGHYGVTWINASKPYERLQSGITTDGKNLVSPKRDDDWLLLLHKRYTGMADQIHLSWENDPETSMTVTWHTIFGNNPCKVEYRTQGKTRTIRETTGISFPSTGKGYLHRVTLNDLEANTSYEYRVSSDRGIDPEFSDWRTFKTAPETLDEPLQIAFVSDIGLHGRLDGNANGTLQIRDEIIDKNPDFVIGCGDYAYANRDARYKTNPEKVDRFFNQYEPLISRIPFMAQYGNHEISLDEKFEDWAPRFAHPKGDAVGKNYSFDIGKAHFTAFFQTGKTPTDSELQWLDQDLQMARANDAKWLIVFQHEPIYAYGRSHPSKIEIAERLIPVLEKHGVDLHLSSHDQNYERTYPLLGHPRDPEVQSNHPHSYPKGSGVIYAKISPAGKKSETGNRFSEFTVPQQDFIAYRNTGSHHYAMIEIDPKQGVTVTTYSVPEDTLEGEIIDEFTITK